MAAIDFETTSLEDVCEKLASIYQEVHLAHEPNIRWVQIVNDTTMLGEEVRRSRKDAAVERSGKILMRLLEFIGYYSYVYKIVRRPRDKVRFRDFTGIAFQSPSCRKYFKEGDPREGLTRWILAKYPHSCAKCGRRPCRCLMEPWILEDRREKPGPYERYKRAADARRKALKGRWRGEYLTLADLGPFFNRIYRATRHHQEPWKLAMHLVEELGEATIALSRIELAFVAYRDDFDLKPWYKDIEEQVAEGKIDKQTEKIKPTAIRDKIRLTSKNELKQLIGELRSGRPWHHLVELASERLKEEIADVFSWLIAVIYKLRDDEEEVVMHDLRERVQHYIGPAGFKTGLKCPWCKRESCKNDCLVRHAVASELTEKALKF